MKFQPWVGDHYHSSRYGVRVMVLGESHYGEPEDYAPDFTQHVINEHAFQPGLRFFTIATNLLRGTTDEPTAEEPRQPGGCKLKTAPVRPVVAARPAEYVCSEDLFY
ncbi:TPA: hypothetical protein ACNPTZ_005348 [Escherichia coli]